MELERDAQGAVAPDHDQALDPGLARVGQDLGRAVDEVAVRQAAGEGVGPVGGSQDGPPLAVEVPHVGAGQVLVALLEQPLEPVEDPDRLQPAFALGGAHDGA